MKIIEPCSLPNDDRQKQLLIDFVEGFKQRYGAMPDQTASHATDVFAMLKAALDNTSGPLTRERSRSGVETVEVCAAAGCRKVTPIDHRGLKGRDGARAGQVWTLGGAAPSCCREPDSW